MKVTTILKRLGVLLLPFLLPLAATAAHNYVDLGLPSGTLWADCNVGASTPEGYGNFYAWGETKTKDTYSWSNYQYASGSSSTAQDIGTHIAGTKYDAAKAVWGSDWVMPTLDQANELLNKCTISLATVNNVKGLRFKGPNGNTIFFPMTGYKYDSNYSKEGTQCYIWTDTKDIVTKVAYKSMALYIERSSSSAKANTQAAPRRSGVIVRAVKNPNDGPVISDDPVIPEEDVLVDLGLSVRWSSMNLGADAASGYGNYYAWGETATKSTYTWANYQHASGSSSTVKNIGSNIQATQYDVAYKCFESYDPILDKDVKTCLPTKAQWEELQSKCTWKEATKDGHKGYTVTGPSKESIFLPFSGTSYDGSLHNVGSYSYYWSSEVYTDASKAYAFNIKTATTPKLSYAQRRTGLPVRAVEYKTSTPTPPPSTDHNYVDLGLPSGTLWADCNVGASTPEGYGNFYAWGETKTKDTYSWSNYQYASGSSSTAQDIGTHIAGTKYDAAKAVWGSDWVMPTLDQANELLNKCTISLATVNNVNGLRFKGPNGNTIFFPMTGYKYDSNYSKEGTQCYIWTDTKDIVTKVAYKSMALYIERSSSSAKANTQAAPRRSGVIVRAVKTGGGQVDPLGPPAKSPEMVDLGLSVKWCDQNLGADWESEYGEYFAWGETSPKSTYTWANYQHANGSSSSVKNIGSEISCTEYDAAYIWDKDCVEPGTMCLPTKAQWEELRTKCTWKEATEYDHKGYRITGPSGESIFLPFTGSSYDGSLHNVDTYAYYWSSEIYTDASKAYAFNIKTATAPKLSYAQRRTGLPIRAVEVSGQLPDAHITESILPKLVDLGLSVKWCDVNLACINDTDDGERFSYFAWGETDTKSDYTWANYEHANGTASSVQNIGSNIQATSYDPAYVNEYEEWSEGVCAPRRNAPGNGMAKTAYDPKTGKDVDICMATKAQWEELLTKCTWTETTVRKHKGYKVTGPSGNSIFLPFSGTYYDGSAHNVNTSAYYWTSEVNASNTQQANAFYIKTATAPKLSYAQRRTGLAIRAVEYKQATASSEMYAVLSGSTLTFYYDNQKSSRSGTKYGMNTGTNSPAWLSKASSITKVVFNSSFANARPTTCYMWFDGMENLTTITGVSYFNTSNVTNMSCMFAVCSSLTSIDLSKFNTANVTDMSWMFTDCSNITSLDLSKFNTAKVTNMACMFEWCEKLTSVNVSSFNTSKVADMSTMFYRCQKLKSLDLSNFVFPSSNTVEMIGNCVALTSLSISSTATRLNANACTGVGTTSNPCTITAPAGFSFGVSTSGSYFKWKSGYFKLASSSDTHQYVDLGLPSGTLWATCNVGASVPEGYGNFYAWGETKTKDTYSWSNYEYASGSSSTCQDIGTHIAGTSYDVAKAVWGSNWKMPTLDQANELLNKCTISLATVNNVNGLRFKGPNGNTIFFPMTGYKYDSNYSKEGTQCYIWTDTKDIVTKVAYKSMALYIERSSSSAKANTQAAPRRSGVVVRAVRAGSGNANTYDFDTDDVRGVNIVPPYDGSTYTIQGVKVEGELKPGIYIRNGKKFVVK